MSAIPGTRASAPIIPATASMVPDHAAEDDRDERVGQRQRRNEHRAGDDDEERDAEVPPEEPRLEPAQDVKARRDGLDAPAALDRLGSRHPPLRLDDWRVIPATSSSPRRRTRSRTRPREEKLAAAREASRARARLACARHRVGARRAGAASRREFGCSVHGIEISPDFHAVAVERAEQPGSRSGSPSSSATARRRRSSPRPTTPRSASARASSTAASPTPSTRSRPPFVPAATSWSASRTGAGFRCPTTTRIASSRGRRSKGRS